MPVAVAVVLGGGRSSRMGQDKLALVVDGVSLLRRACLAALTRADRVVVAGPPRAGFEDLPVEFVAEDPPFGGPVAGLAAAVATLPPAVDEVLVLAGDLAHPDEVARLLAEGALEDDGVALVDDDGWTQYLAARYRVAALREALGGESRDRSVRRALAGLNLAKVSAPNQALSDLDTPADARSAGAVERDYDDT